MGETKLNRQTRMDSMETPAVSIEKKIKNGQFY